MVQLSCSLLKTGVNVRRPTRGVQSAKKMSFAVILMQFGGWRMRSFNRNLCKKKDCFSSVNWLEVFEYKMSYRSKIICFIS